jgi:hypothetical protein
MYKMSERTIDELLEKESVPRETFTEDDIYEGGEYYEDKKSEFFNKIMTAETGTGSISDYIDHPMNFNKSQGLAQMLRGLTGIIGNLNLAIIDVVFGALRFSKEKRGTINHDVPSGGNLPS